MQSTIEAGQAIDNRISSWHSCHIMARQHVVLSLVCLAHSCLTLPMCLLPDVSHKAEQLSLQAVGIWDIQEPAVFVFISKLDCCCVLRIEACCVCSTAQA